MNVLHEEKEIVTRMGCNSMLQGNCNAAIKSYIHLVSAGSLKLRDEGDTVQSRVCS